MKVAVYSVMIGDYDNWYDPINFDSGYDYYLFTDQPVKSEVYRVVPISGNNLDQRYIKIVIPSILWQYDFTIYHDASITQIMEVADLVESQQTDMMLINHPIRNCIYQEYEACCVASKDDAVVMHDQVQRYINEGYPKDNGLVATGLIFRVNCARVTNFCSLWFDEVHNGSIRDQLSFNYIAHKLKFKIDLLPWSVLGSHFIIKKHK